MIQILISILFYQSIRIDSMHILNPLQYILPEKCICLMIIGWKIRGVG